MKVEIWKSGNYETVRPTRDCLVRPWILRRDNIHIVRFEDSPYTGLRAVARMDNLIGSGVTVTE